jgi:hypothetical protein
MIVDNFNQINSLLAFNSSKEFYFLQIIKRRKDNPGLSRDQKLIRNYYLYENDLLKLRDSIIESCVSNNARAYIRLNRRNDEIVALHMNKVLADYLYQGEYKACQHLYDTCCGISHSEKHKKWIIDLDDRIDSQIKWWKEKLEDNFIDILPTLNGYHIITHAFNTKEFKERYYGNAIMPDLHKDNPTLLYYENTCRPESNNMET